MINSFAIHVYNDKDAIINALNAGSVTATAELGGEDSSRVVSSNYYRRFSDIDAGAFAFFNTTKGVLSNSDLRRAIRGGLKLSEIRSVAPNTTALNFPILKSQIELYDYPSVPTDNLEEAKSKVSEILNGEKPTLEIATVDNGYLPAVAEKIAENLRELGFDTRVIPYAESQEFVANVISKRNYDILVYEIELGSDPDPLPYYHSSQAKASGLNLSNYRNALVDDLLIGARGTMSDVLRIKKYEKFLEYWATDVPAVGLYQANMTYIYNKNVQSYNEKNTLVTALDRFLDVENWAVNKGTKNQTP
jgi:ABC-type transport system substrate-binding protein